MVLEGRREGTKHYTHTRMFCFQGKNDVDGRNEGAWRYEYSYTPTPVLTRRPAAHSSVASDFASPLRSHLSFPLHSVMVSTSPNFAPQS
jgi:hypothetical protein